jgi:hypothetical protein
MNLRFCLKEYFLIPPDYKTGVDNESEKGLMLSQD